MQSFPTIKINPVDVYSDSGGYDADTEDEFISQAGNDCISICGIPGRTQLNSLSSQN
jgi:hypothetical protein